MVTPQKEQETEEGCWWKRWILQTQCTHTHTYTHSHVHNLCRMPWMMHECDRTCHARLHSFVCGSKTFSLQPSPAGGGAVRGGATLGNTRVWLWQSKDGVGGQYECFAVLPANSSSLPLHSAKKRAVTGSISAVQACGAALAAIFLWEEFPFFPYSFVD